MKKHLIYLGWTGTAHRIAMFDENNILVRKVPVKDVPVLTDDLQFLNCTVINGNPVPNLQGAKVLASRDRKTHSQTQAIYRFRFEPLIRKRELWAFPNTPPIY